MLVKIDDEVLYEIDDTMIGLISHDIANPIEDIKRRLRWVIEHKCEQCLSRMEKEYIEVINNDSSIKSLPKNKIELAEMIMSHPLYKNKQQREIEN